MANKNSLPKRTWILIGVFVITAVVGISVIKKVDVERARLLEQSMNDMTPVQGQPKTGTSAAKAAKLYTDMVKQYEGKRIQFDMNCQAIPNNITYKNGTNIMLDNRSGDARIITVGGVQHSLAGYGYKVVTLTSQTLPKTILLSCGAAVNVGQILLQK